MCLHIKHNPTFICRPERCNQTEYTSVCACGRKPHGRGRSGAAVGRGPERRCTCVGPAPSPSSPGGSLSSLPQAGCGAAGCRLPRTRRCEGAGVPPPGLVPNGPSPRLCPASRSFRPPPSPTKVGTTPSVPGDVRPGARSEARVQGARRRVPGR